jgi:uncharacterized membrane protein (UPF0127 family)
MKIKRLLNIVICLVIIIGFGYGETKMISLYIGKIKFTVEIADTVEKQLRGLMFRKSIPDDFGMLFVHQEEDSRGIWMKNTLVHLDIIYLNKDKEVVDMYINVPPCKKDPCQTYISKVPAQYVLEIRGNLSKELDLKLGDTIVFILD